MSNQCTCTSSFLTNNHFSASLLHLYLQVNNNNNNTVRSAHTRSNTRAGYSAHCRSVASPQDTQIGRCIASSRWLTRRRHTEERQMTAGDRVRITRSFTHAHVCADAPATHAHALLLLGAHLHTHAHRDAPTWCCFCFSLSLSRSSQRAKCQLLQRVSERPPFETKLN